MSHILYLLLDQISMESYTCALLRRQNSGNYHFVTYARCTPEDTIGNAEKKLLADYYNPLCSAFEAEPADSLELYGVRLSSQSAIPMIPLLSVRANS